MRAGFGVPIALVAVAACTAGPPATPSPTTASTAIAKSAAPTEIAATPTPLSGGSPVAGGTVTLLDAGCGYVGPAVVPAGEVVLELENRSAGQFDADLWRLGDGHAYAELAAHIDQERENLENGLPGLGHPTFATLVGEATVMAESGTLAARLAAASYGLACIRFGGGQPVAMWAAGPVTVGN